MAKPPFPWVGSKRKLLQFIFQLLPSDIQNYIEPFGGSGAVILEMRASSKRRDVYNDLNRNLTNFFVCLRDKTNALLRELKFLPIQSRWLFEVYKLFLAHEEIHWKVYEKNIREEIQILEDRTCFTEEQAEELRPIYDQKLENFDVERAAMFYKCIRGSYSATVSSFGSKALRLFNFLYLLKPAAKRLEDVVIENKNAIIRALELVRCVPLFPTDREGESILSSDPRNHEFWAKRPEAILAMETCKRMLRLRYMTRGIIRVPIPDAEELPKELKGKRLWMKDPHDDPKTAIQRVRVIGKGLMPPRVLQEKVNPPHLVFEYWVDLITSDGAYDYRPMQPWMFDLLAQQTLEQMKKEKEE